MMQSVDILVLYALALLPESTIDGVQRAFAGLLEPSVIRGVIARSERSGLYSAAHAHVNRTLLDRFVRDAMRILMPAEYIGRGVGIPTAASSPLLVSRLRTAGDRPVVWKAGGAGVSGELLVPFHPAAPRSFALDERLYHALTLVEAMRSSWVRERDAAYDALRAVRVAKDRVEAA